MVADSKSHGMCKSPSESRLSESKLIPPFLKMLYPSQFTVTLSAGIPAYYKIYQLFPTMGDTTFPENGPKTYRIIPM